MLPEGSECPGRAPPPSTQMPQCHAPLPPLQIRCVLSESRPQGHPAGHPALGFQSPDMTLGVGPSGLHLRPQMCPACAVCSAGACVPSGTACRLLRAGAQASYSIRLALLVLGSHSLVQDVHTEPCHVQALRSPDQWLTPWLQTIIRVLPGMTETTDPLPRRSNLVCMFCMLFCCITWK